MRDAMKGQERLGEEERRLDGRIIGALEHAPPVRVPEGFAAQVAARLPERTPVVRRFHYGYAAVAASLVLLLGAMLWLAPRAASHSLYWIGFEWLLCAQFCGAAVWLGLLRGRME